AFERTPVEPADHRQILRGRTRAALLPFVHSVLGREAAALQAGDDVAAIGEVADVAEDARADLAPCGRQNAVLDLRTVRAEVRGRLVLLVDQSHRPQPQSAP